MGKPGNFHRCKVPRNLCPSYSTFSVLWAHQKVPFVAWDGYVFAHLLYLRNKDVPSPEPFPIGGRAVRENFMRFESLSINSQLCHKSLWFSQLAGLTTIIAFSNAFFATCIMTVDSFFSVWTACSSHSMASAWKLVTNACFPMA